MLAIPDPCNEDFSKMNTTERGAFCGKCKIDTFDFRHLSDLEVNTLLYLHKDEHLCGRLTTGQLTSLNRGYQNWIDQRTPTFRSKFVLALVLVFGLSLFSCDQKEAQTINSLNTITFVKSNSKLDFVSDILNNEDFKLTDYTEDSAEPVQTCNQNEYEGEIDFLGDVAFIAEPEMPNEVLGGIPVEIEPHVAGGLVAPNYEMYLQDTLGVSLKNQPLIENNNLAHHFTTSAYPNPTQDQSTIRLSIEEKARFSIQLYDMNGRLMESIYSGKLDIGTSEFKINLGSYQSGIYIVKVVSRDQNETVKIQKLT